MKFLVLTHVIHKKHGSTYYAYAPYVREMNLWFRNVDEVILIAPLQTGALESIEKSYVHEKIQFLQVPAFQFTSIQSTLTAIWNIPGILKTIFLAMRKANHIHLRCPGNMGLLGSFVQIVFPGKKKTAKYAGNWDWNSRQPLSYRIQQYILRNTFLTRNMTALVYGKWPDQNRNILPFFTASYSESEQIQVNKPDFISGVRLIFVGGLVPGKRPLLASKTLKLIIDKGIHAQLTYCGDGPERQTIEQFAEKNNLLDKITVLGNVNPDEVKKELINAHFLIFASQSEGWPKAVAEAMWWGCVPITTAVSCVPEMVGHGERGDLVIPDKKAITERIMYYLNDPNMYRHKSDKAVEWSQQYTLERFEEAITQLLHK